LKLNGQAAKSTLANWQAFTKSPIFVSVIIKFSIFLLIPLVTFFQDIMQVLNLAWSDAEAQYVLLVPFVVAYFFYRRRRAFLVSRQNSKLQDLLGISLSLVALLIYVLGSYSFYALQLHLLSLPIFVAAVTLLVFGADAFRLLIFPIAMLTFLSPFPLFFMDALGGSLMSSDGTLAAALLSPFMPIDIVYQPIVILTTMTTAGETIQFSLSAACSGIYSLTAFLFCAVVFGYLASGSIAKKVLYGVIAVIAAYFLNVFRIVATVLLGRFFGLGIAVEFFHAVGGTVLAFAGTLVLLYFGSKLLKLSFVPKRSQICLSCPSAKDVCAKCGKIVHWPKSRINWKRLAILLVFLVVCADLIAQASAVNYNKIVNTDESAVAFNPSTGELSAFSNQTGWSAVFMGRETQAEEQLGLVFVGDYFLTKIDSPSDTVYAIFEVSDLQSKFHTWEGCLNYQAYPIHVESIKYATIYDQNTNIVNGEIITANAPTLNQSINLVYWFDSLNLKTNNTVTSYSVKITLIKYVPNANDQIDQAGSQAAITKLLTLSQSYENIWSQYKQSNSTFVVDLYHNGAAFTAVVTAILLVSMALVFGKRFLTVAAARKKIAGLPEADKAFLEQLKKASSPKSDEPLPENATEKIETLRQQKVIHEKISAKNDEIYMHWVPY
jgi:exosortase